MSDPVDGCDSDRMNSQLDDGDRDLGVVEDVAMSTPSPPSSLSRFDSACLEIGWEKWLLTVYIRVPHFVFNLSQERVWPARLILCMPVSVRRSVYLPSVSI